MDIDIVGPTFTLFPIERREKPSEVDTSYWKRADLPDNGCADAIITGTKGIRILIIGERADNDCEEGDVNAVVGDYFYDSDSKTKLGVFSCGIFMIMILVFL